MNIHLAFLIKLDHIPRFTFLYRRGTIKRKEWVYYLYELILWIVMQQKRLHSIQAQLSMMRAELYEKNAQTILALVNFHFFFIRQ